MIKRLKKIKQTNLSDLSFFSAGLPDGDLPQKAVIGINHCKTRKKKSGGGVTLTAVLYY